MNEARGRELLIEQVVGAWRARNADGAIEPHPALYDLDPAGREQAYAEQLRARRLEAALDPDGLSTTARAVLARILRP